MCLCKSLWDWTEVSLSIGCTCSGSGSAEYHVLFCLFSELNSLKEACSLE